MQRYRNSQPGLEMLRNASVAPPSQHHRKYKYERVALFGKIHQIHAGDSGGFVVAALSNVAMEPPFVMLSQLETS